MNYSKKKSLNFKRKLLKQILILYFELLQHGLPKQICSSNNYGIILRLFIYFSPISKKILQIFWIDNLKKPTWFQFQSFPTFLSLRFEILGVSLITPTIQKKSDASRKIWKFVTIRFFFTIRYVIGVSWNT